MTSVGKTYTMQGADGTIGLVQLATYDLLRSLSLKYSPSEFRVIISYVEVYNEVILYFYNNYLYFIFNISIY